MRVIDSHTAGEPTRVIIDGGPDLGTRSLVERAARLEAEHQDFCDAVLLEPRGHEAMVGALLVEPSDTECDYRHCCHTSPSWPDNPRKV